MTRVSDRVVEDDLTGSEILDLLRLHPAPGRLQSWRSGDIRFNLHSSCPKLGPPPKLC